MAKMSFIARASIPVASSVLYGSLGAVCFFNSDPGGGWHATWAFCLIMSAIIAMWSVPALIVALVRRYLGYVDSM